MLAPMAHGFSPFVTSGLAAAMALACSPLQRHGAPAAATGVTARAAPCTGAAVCEDFEAYPVGRPPRGPWTVVATAGENAVVDAGKAWSGTRSVLVRHSGTAHHAIYIAIGKPALPLPSNDLHGRLMLFIARVPQRLHWDNVRASGPLPSGAEAQYNLGGENASFLSNYEPHDCYRRTHVPYPQGRWACLQWQFSGPNNEFRVWLDGQPVEEATVQRFGQGCVDKSNSEWVSPRFEQLQLGWEQYRGSDPIDLWIDDVAVGQTRIGCPAMRPDVGQKTPASPSEPRD
jgi:hypothetical protein